MGVLGILVLAAGPVGLIAQGGGPLGLEAPRDCIAPAERRYVQEQIRRYEASTLPDYGPLTPASQRYAFYPQAGVLWEDIFVNNFVDMDPTGGILDWDCSGFTYDGHRGHDSDLKTFTEQDIGVPIYAALPGTVVARADGNPDKNTSWGNQPANYVVLHHGGTHYTYYWHMKNGSVAVQVGDWVRLGQQIGQTASSGVSTGPHLHFETWDQGTWLEPSAGACNPGESNWTAQIPIRRDNYLRDFNITWTNLANEPSLPWDKPRTGTFVQGVRPVYFWVNSHNHAASSTWRVRLIRPNGVQAYDSGTGSFNNPFYRWSWWWWGYNFNLFEVGEWRLELSFNGSVMVSAPLLVVATAGEVANRPPYPATGRFDPPNPRPEEAAIVRVDSDLLLDDPDYEEVRYRYRWYENGDLVRDVVSAARSDVLRAGKGPRRLECRVDVGDSLVWRRGFTAVPVSRRGSS